MWDEAAAKFAFAIGDLVIHKTTAHHGSVAIRYVVLERLLAECHGGIQRHYLVKALIQEAAFSRRDHALEMHGTQMNETELQVAPAAETEIDRAERAISELSARLKDSPKNNTDVAAG